MEDLSREQQRAYSFGRRSLVEGRSMKYVDRIIRKNITDIDAQNKIMSRLQTAWDNGHIERDEGRTTLRVSKRNDAIVAVVIGSVLLIFSILMLSGYWLKDYVVVHFGLLAGGLAFVGKGIKDLKN